MAHMAAHALTFDNLLALTAIVVTLVGLAGMARDARRRK